MARKVFCEMDQVEADGLDFAPWPGEAGKRVFAGMLYLLAAYMLYKGLTA